MSYSIRPASLEEVGYLSDLALRSKGYWGYDEAFLDACRGELTVHAHALKVKPTWVLQENSRIWGFYVLASKTETIAELDLLYVDPEAMGRGYGRALMGHALAQARKAGNKTMGIVADPHAVGFYRAMGAVEIGSEPSGSIPGRMLPLMELSLVH